MLESDLKRHPLAAPDVAMSSCAAMAPTGPQNMPLSRNEDDPTSLSKLDKQVAVLTTEFKNLNMTVKEGFAVVERKLEQESGRYVTKDSVDKDLKGLSERIGSLEKARNWFVLLVGAMIVGAVINTVLKQPVVQPTVEIHSSSH